MTSKNKYYIACVVLALGLVGIKYIMTDCIVMCMDWYDDKPIYIDPVEVDTSNLA